MPRGPPAAQPGGHGADDTGPGGQRGPGADRPAHRLLRPARQRRADHRRGRLGERAGHRVHECPRHLHRAAGSRVEPGHRGGACDGRPYRGAALACGLELAPRPPRRRAARRAVGGQPAGDLAYPGRAPGDAHTQGDDQRGHRRRDRGLRLRLRVRPARRIRRRGDRRQRYVPDRAVPQPAAEPPQRRVRLAPWPAALKVVDAVAAGLGGAAHRLAAVPVLDRSRPAAAQRRLPVHRRQPDARRLRRPRGRAQRASLAYLHLRGRAPGAPVRPPTPASLPGTARSSAGR